MSYKFINNDGSGCKYVDLPNGSTITCGNKQYKIQDGSIFCYDLQNGKIVGQGKLVNEICMSKEQLSIFGEIAKNDNYTDRLDREDLSLFESSKLKQALKTAYGENTQINKASVNGKSVRYEVEPDYDNKAEYYLKKVGNFFRRVVKKEEKPILERQEKDIVEVKLGQVRQNKKTIKTMKYKEKEYTYQVKDNSTLDTISLETDVPLKKIQRTNPDLWTMKALTPEDKIKIPANDENQKSTKYTVTADETWESIAEKYNINVNDLKQVNARYIETINEPVPGTNLVIPKHKHRTKVKESNVETIPEHTYHVTDIITLKSLASENNISLYRLLEANPDLILRDNNGNPKVDEKGNILYRKIEQGEQLIVPTHKVVTKLDELSVKGIAEQVGISEPYIRSIIVQNVGEDMEPILQLQKNNKSSNPQIGFGHKGNVHGASIKKSLTSSDITITKEEAYQLLANDLYSAKQDAITYFGQNFNKAPQEIQDAIVRLVLDKGIEVFESSDLIKQLKQDIENGNYAAAAANAIVGAVSFEIKVAETPEQTTASANTKGTTKANVTTSRSKTFNFAKNNTNLAPFETLYSCIPKEYEPYIKQAALKAGVSENYIRHLIFVEGDAKTKQAKLDAYYDSKNVLTIGFGHTNKTTNAKNGNSFKEKEHITLEKAFDFLVADIKEHKAITEKYIGKEKFAKLEQTLQEGLIDRSFQAGQKGFKEETIKANINKGIYAAVAARNLWVSGDIRRSCMRFLFTARGMSREEQISAKRRFENLGYYQLAINFFKNPEKNNFINAYNSLG